MKPILSLIIASSLLFSGCATQQEFLNTLGTPAAVQSEITVLGALVKPRITSEPVKAAIHKFASDLRDAGNLDTAQLRALIPRTGNPSGDALIAAGAAFIDSAIAKVGARNQLTISYIKAVSAGLLAAGF